MIVQNHSLKLLKVCRILENIKRQNWVVCCFGSIGIFKTKMCILNVVSSHLNKKYILQQKHCLPPLLRQITSCQYSCSLHYHLQIFYGPDINTEHSSLNPQGQGLSSAVYKKNLFTLADICKLSNFQRQNSLPLNVFKRLDSSKYFLADAVCVG